MPSVEAGLARILRSLAEDMGKGVLDVDAVEDAGDVAIAARHLAGSDYFYVLGNSLYSLAEAIGGIMRVASLPLSTEYRSRLEEVLEMLRREGSGALREMAAHVEGGDECGALRAAARIYGVSDVLSGVARNLRAVTPLIGEEE